MLIDGVLNIFDFCIIHYVISAGPIIWGVTPDHVKGGGGEGGGIIRMIVIWFVPY